MQVTISRLTKVKQSYQIICDDHRWPLHFFAFDAVWNLRRIIIWEPFSKLIQSKHHSLCKQLHLILYLLVRCPHDPCGMCNYTCSKRTCRIVQIFHVRFNKSVALGARIQAISCLSRPPTNLPKRRAWRFYNSILTGAIWGTAPKTTIEAPNAPLSRTFPKSIIFPMKTIGFCGATAGPNSLQSGFRQLI